MFKKLLVVVAIMMVIDGGGTAHAVQTCPAGYYKNTNNACARCDGGYYCPDDDSDERIKCPEWTADDAVAILESLGHTDIISAQFQKFGSWDPLGPDGNGPAWDIIHCYATLDVATRRGNILLQNHWDPDTKRYWHGNLYWYTAAPGWYLSSYIFTSSSVWYRNVKPCTNAPSEHAHYTGPGTPDEPVKTGGATDYNDCPWECDCGYVRSGDVCVPASECTAGVKTLRTGTGLIYKLYSAQTTSPTIAIGLNGNVCYACLAPGAADGALNLEWDAGIFHAINGN